MRLASHIFVVALLVSSVSGSALRTQVAAQPIYKHTTICEISNTPKSSNLKYVEVEAVLVSAIPHGMFLQDQRCPKHILLLGRDLPGADESATDIIRLFFGPNAPRRVKGRFRGRITRDPSTGRLNLSLQMALDLQPLDPAATETEPPRVKRR